MHIGPSLATALPVRKLDIDLHQGFARHWFGGDAFRTAYYNALSMSFPAGGQLFIESVNIALPLLADTPANAALRSCAQILPRKKLRTALCTSNTTACWPSRVCITT